MTALDTARQIWATFDDNERCGANFAMFPADKMQLANGPDGHAVTVALMHIASGKEQATA